MKLMTAGLLALAFALGTTTAVRADAPWALFGDAEAVKLGKGNNWAVALVSEESAPYSGIDHAVKAGTTFADLYHLSTDYVAAVGCFGGGSPRFQINVSDGETVRNVFVYLGTGPSFTDCPEDWTNSGNLIGSTDLRFDTSQVGGTFYDDYEGALELVGNAEVVGIQLVVDGGWSQVDGAQVILVDNVRVNNQTFKAKGQSKK